MTATEHPADDLIDAARAMQELTLFLAKSVYDDAGALQPNETATLLGLLGSSLNNVDEVLHGLRKSKSCAAANPVASLLNQARKPLVAARQLVTQASAAAYRIDGA